MNRGFAAAWIVLAAGAAAALAGVQGEEPPKPADPAKPVDPATPPVPSHAASKAPAGGVCVKCHKSVSPGVVADWQASKHAQNDVDCATCHGD